MTTKQANFEWMCDILGSKSRYLVLINDFMKCEYGIEAEYKYYKKNSEWCVFYRKSGKSLAIAGIKPEELTVTVVIGASLEDRLRIDGLSKRIMNLFDNAYQFHDGRWLKFEVNSEMDIEEIRKLVHIKRKPQGL